MFYVLDGTVRLQIDEETVELAAGGFACIPPGVVHTFSNPTDASVRFLNFNTPSGWENYMRDLDKALAGGTPTQAEIGEIASRYDFKSPDRTAVLTIKGSGGPREVVLLIRRNTVCRSARHGQPPRGALGSSGRGVGRARRWSVSSAGVGRGRCQ
jgi:hypothetical protein